MALGYDQLLMGLSKMLKGREIDLDGSRSINSREDEIARVFADDRGRGATIDGRPQNTSSGEFLNRMYGKPGFGDLNSEEIMALLELDLGNLYDKQNSPAMQKAMADNPNLKQIQAYDQARKILAPLIDKQKQFMNNYYSGTDVTGYGPDVDTGLDWAGRDRKTGISNLFRNEKRTRQ